MRTPEPVSPPYFRCRPGWIRRAYNPGRDSHRVPQSAYPHARLHENPANPNDRGMIPSWRLVLYLGHCGQNREYRPDLRQIGHPRDRHARPTGFRAALAIGYVRNRRIP